MNKPVKDTIREIELSSWKQMYPETLGSSKEEIEKGHQRQSQFLEEVKSTIDKICGKQGRYVHYHVPQDSYSFLEAWLSNDPNFNGGISHGQILDSDFHYLKIEFSRYGNLYRILHGVISTTRKFIFDTEYGDNKETVVEIAEALAFISLTLLPEEYWQKVYEYPEEYYKGMPLEQRIFGYY
jgi:hypothetical protein